MSFLKSDAEEFIKALYRFFLLREPDVEGLDTYSNLISNPNVLSNEYYEILKIFSSNKEFTTKRDEFIKKHIDSSYEGNYKNELLNLLKYSQNELSKQKNLLISGLFRSGTTAVTSLLNFSPEAFISQEVFDYTDIAVWEKKYYTKDHIRGCLYSASNPQLAFSKINTLYRKKFADDIDYIHNPLFMGRYFENIDFTNENLYKFCIKKTQYVLNHYECLHLVGDKLPLVNFKDIIIGLLINKNLHILFMIRNPRDIFYSAKLMEKHDPNFPPINYENFSSAVKNTYYLINILQNYCPNRITLVQYENFFQSRERIEKLFSTLNLNTLSIYEPGINFIIEQDKHLSATRQDRYHKVKNDNINFDESFFKEIQQSINLSNII